MPTNHIVLVPLTLLAGFFLGYWWGAKTVRAQWEKAERRRQQSEV